MSASTPKQPPHSVEAEQSVLGGLMLDNRAWYEVADRLSEADFYSAQHRLIFRTLAALLSGAKPCDFVTLSEQLRQEGKLEEAGGIAYLGSLSADTPGAANIRAYAEIVRERSILRSLIATGQEIAGLGFNPDGQDHGHLIDLAEQAVFRIRERGQRAQSGFFAMPPLIGQIEDKLERLRRDPDSFSGAATGFPKLDEIINGLHSSDLIIVAGRPGMGKCLAHDSQLVADDGTLTTIEALFRERHSRVATLHSDWTFGRAEPSDYVDDGKKPVFEVVTRLGRRVKTTLPHPFLTIRGWKPLADIRLGDYVAVPRTLPVFGVLSMRDCEVRLLAYLSSDAGLIGPSPSLYTFSPEIERDFVSAVVAFGGCRVDRNRTDSALVKLAIVHDRMPEVVQSALTQRWSKVEVQAKGCLPALSSKDATVEAGLFHHARRDQIINPVSLWLRELGFSDAVGTVDRIASAVFRLPRMQLADFLSRLFAADGQVTIDPDGRIEISYSCSREQVVREVQHLLTRFGIVARMLHRVIRSGGAVHSSWQLKITDARSLREFASQVGIFGRETDVARVREELTHRDRGDRSDLIPVEIWFLLERAKGAMSWRDLARRAAVPEAGLGVHRRGLRRDYLARMAMVLGDAELSALATAEVYWDRVEQITPLGARQVYDLTISGTHNFVANDICVHNTSFAMNIAEHVAIEKKLSVAVFSMEMSAEQLALRILSSYGRIDQQKLRNGTLDDTDWDRLASTGGLLRDAPLFIDETGSLSPLDLRARARRIAARHGDLSLIVVDYIQLMQVPSTRENRTNEISEISRSLKALAKELSVPIIALSQLSRGVEQRDNKRPRMSDLRESGGIEQDADVVLFVYRDEYYSKEQCAEPGVAEIIVAKQRNGPTGTIKAAFVGRYTRFDSLTHEYVYE